MKRINWGQALAGVALTAIAAGAAEVEPGFVPLFNGKDLTGWVGATDGYVVEDGNLLCLKEKGGMLFTERDYANFVLRLEFKVPPGGNNGIGIRSPRKGDPAFVGYEVQILDDTAPQYANLQPAQYCGSLYKIAAAERGHLKPVGEWNVEEIIAEGDHITVMMNGAKIVDANVATHGRPESGAIGFLGHGSRVEFRNVRIQELHNIPPRGFTALFNGRDLAGWKGLVADPLKRAKMTPEQLKAEQAKADENMRAHWKVEDGVIVFDGKGQNLCTAKPYRDFEMLVDWKINAGGDSGIYLRGSPQVQIWDPAKSNVGSGGLYNNQKNPSKPTVTADRPVGEWNTFRIKMVNDKVTVHLNGQLVVDNVVMENYWDRSQPIFREDAIELQNHGGPLWFRNVFVRELTE